jgi:hypothetical protein
MRGDRAHASDVTWSFSWSAPPPCPNQQAVRATVEAWLARSIEPIDTHGIRVHARVEPKPDGFALDLTLESRSGRTQEQMVAARCETLAGVVALKVALAADPGAGFIASQPQPKSPARRVGLSLRAASGVMYGVLPSLGAVLGGAGSLRFAHVALELGATYAFPSEVHHHEVHSAGANVDLVSGSGRICLLQALAMLELLVCGGADAGRMRAHGFGLGSSRETREPWVALGFGPALRWPASRWFSGWFGVDALASIVRPTFQILNLGALYTPPAVGVRVQVGGELNLF